MLVYKFTNALPCSIGALVLGAYVQCFVSYCNVGEGESRNKSDNRCKWLEYGMSQTHFLLPPQASLANTVPAGNWESNILLNGVMSKHLCIISKAGKSRTCPPESR